MSSLRRIRSIHKAEHSAVKSQPTQRALPLTVPTTVQWLHPPLLTVAVCRGVVVFGRQHLAHLDLLARCHHKLGDLPAALSFQQQMVALRPSISNLLLLARMMAENHSQTSDVSDCTVQRQARAAVLMRCIELCPVHAPAWHELGLVLLALSDSAFVPGPPASHPSSARCCSRESFLWSARLVFSLVADLTNFTLSPSHPAGDIPSLSRPLYSSLLASAQRHIDQLNTQLPAVGSGKKRSECTRCVGVCKCWRQQLHRFACLPLASLFVIEKGAESARVEGSKRAEKRGGKRRGGEEDDSEDETTADVDQFDILNL